MLNGKMYKVLFPIEGSDGKTTHWIRGGTAFTNKDESLNAYIDSIPLTVFAGKPFKLQIRELEEGELRRRDGDARSSRGNGLSTTEFPPHERQGSLDPSGPPF
jgi:hypothetical protein